MELHLSLPYGEFDTVLRKGKYADGSTAIRLDTTQGEPFCVLTVALEDRMPNGEREIFVKNWSENAPVVAALKEVAMDKIFRDTGNRLFLGPHDVEVEVWEIVSQEVLDAMEPL